MHIDRKIQICVTNFDAISNFESSSNDVTTSTVPPIQRVVPIRQGLYGGTQTAQNARQPSIQWLRLLSEVCPNLGPHVLTFAKPGG